MAVRGALASNMLAAHRHARSCKARATPVVASAAGGKPILYTNERSRSQIIDWLLLELGAEDRVERVELDMSAGEHKKSGYLAMHPFGQVPALRCADGTPVFESGAILLYLASAFGGASTPERLGGMASWIVWVNASFWPGVTGANRAVALPKLATPLNELLAKRTWLLGEEFTAADVAVGAYLVYSTLFMRIQWDAYPAIARYVGAIEKRPAFHKTVGSE